MSLSHLTFTVVVAIASKPHSQRRCLTNANTTDTFMQRFLAQVSPKAFFGKYWGKKPVVLQGHSMGRDYSDLFSLQDLEIAVAHDSSSDKRLRQGEPMRYNRDVRLPQESRQGTSASFKTKAGHKLADGDAMDNFVSDVRELIVEGRTMLLWGFHGFWRPVLDFTRSFENYLEWPMVSTVYVTGPGYTGFDIHWDTTPTFFVQISGQKHWRVWAPFVTAPLLERHIFGNESDKLAGIKAPRVAQTNEERRKWKDAQKLLVEATLLPGDVLYMPRGFLHEGFVPAVGIANGSGAGMESVHVTVSAVNGGSNWGEFLESTPFLSMSGQPPLPGKASHHNANSTSFVPHEGFHETVTRGWPPALREEMPPRLSRHCSERKFHRLIMKKLRALDPQASEERVAAPFRELPMEALRDMCRAFLVGQLAEMLSEHVRMDSKPSIKIGLKTPLCVSGPTAAGISPPWLTNANEQTQAEDADALLTHSGLNGPARIKSAQPRTMPIPSWMSSALATSLHSESNPSGYLEAVDVIDRLPTRKGGAKEVLAMLQGLLARHVLERAPDNKLGAAEEL